MNSWFYFIGRKVSHALLILILATLSACSIYDDTSECYSGFRVRYMYDYNMKFADAFTNEVNQITLFVFDDKGNFITSKTESGTELKKKNYFMELDIPPATYHLITWAGLTGQSFRLTEPARDKPSLAQFKVTLNDKSKTSDSSLQPLWHGEIEKVVVGTKYEEVTIPLVKDTKRIRVVLQQINGLPVTDSDFRFEITDDNSLMNYDNSIIPNGNITYAPYATGHSTVGDIQPATAVFAELHTGRLMTDSKARLKIFRNSDNSEIIDIPLIDYLLLTEMEGHKRILTEQEYLDRQDEYSLVFFLDDNLAWMKVQIIVNGWTVRFNNGSLE